MRLNNNRNAMKKLRQIPIIIFVTLVIAIFPSQIVYADVGPKFFPFTFNFINDTKSITVISGILLTCNDIECKSPTSSTELWCFPGQCVSRFDPPKAPYYKIEIKFSDKTRTSNIFSQVRLSANYNVRFIQDGLEVQEAFRTGFSSGSLLKLLFIPALLITVIVEKIVAGLFSKKWKIHLRWIGRINLISLIVVWYVFPALPIPLRWVWFLAEIFVILFEILLIAYANKAYNLSITKFSTLSILANLSSIIAGVIIPVVFLFFGWIVQECIQSTDCNISDYLRWLSGFFSLADYMY